MTAAVEAGNRQLNLGVKHGSRLLDNDVAVFVDSPAVVCTQVFELSAFQVLPRTFFPDMLGQIVEAGFLEDEVDRFVFHRSSYRIAHRLP